MQFGSLHEEAQRLVRLSRSLDSLADNGRSDRIAACQDIDLGQAVRSAFEVARPAFDAKEIEVDVAVPAGPVARPEPGRLPPCVAYLAHNSPRSPPRGGPAAMP